MVVLSSILSRRTKIRRQVEDQEDFQDEPEDTPVSERTSKRIKGTLDLLNIEDICSIDPTWREDALCRNNPNFIIDDFFMVSITKKNIRKVLEINNLCRECPVAPECLHEALIFNYDGIWAGTTARQRKVYIQTTRNSTVEDLTIEECKQMVQDLHTFNETPGTIRLRYKNLKSKTSLTNFLNSKNKSTSN